MPSPPTPLQPHPGEEQPENPTGTPVSVAFRVASTWDEVRPPKLEKLARVEGTTDLDPQDDANDSRSSHACSQSSLLADILKVHGLPPAGSRLNPTLRVLWLLSTVSSVVGSVIVVSWQVLLLGRNGLELPCDPVSIATWEHRPLMPKVAESAFFHHTTSSLPVLRILIAAPAALWITRVASTPYMRRACSLVGLVWLDSVLYGLHSVAKCAGVHATSVWLTLVEFSSALVLVSIFPYCLWLVLRQIRVLEESSQRDFHSLRMKRALVASFPPLFVGSIVAVGVSLNLWSGQVVSSIICMVVALWLVGTTVVAFSGLRSAARSATCAAQSTPQNNLALTARRAIWALQLQGWGAAAALTGTMLNMMSHFVYRIGWPYDPPVDVLPYMMAAARICALLNSTVNIVFALALSGATRGAASAARARGKIEKARQRRWKKFAKQWQLAHSARPAELRAWDNKVKELAGRGITLDALLQFYKRLDEHMPHFSPHCHTTLDVVRGAIIPISSQQRCACAQVLMKWEYTRPHKMCTHNWNNLFAHLIAAVVADALEEAEYAVIAFLLSYDVAALEQILRERGLQSRAYWICAFAVNQHSGICGGNPDEEKDSVTGLLHPKCACGLEKAWNGTPPLLLDGRSVPCEMNKFDEMMEYLSSTDESFEQVVAIDAEFELFTRAWCISEIASASAAGMRQRLKIQSQDSLTQNREMLSGLMIQDMKATREEDKQRILEAIDDVETFNLGLRHLLLVELIPAWDSLDVLEQMGYVGRLIRWQHVVDTRGTVTLWHTSTEHRERISTV